MVVEEDESQNIFPERGLPAVSPNDAVILYAAIKGRADRVVTLNDGDFRQIYPQMAEKIVSP